MKRKDFLRKMRNRRFGEVQQREPERRRAVDWRTLRVDLPADGETEQREAIPVGSVTRLASGIRLEADSACWVRGYRIWEAEDGGRRAEFQYRPNEDGDPAPPGAEAIDAGQSWQPAG
jgi:hypothetical protein